MKNMIKIHGLLKANIKIYLKNALIFQFNSDPLDFPKKTSLKCSI